MNRHWRELKGALIATAITPFAIGAAVASAGAGHGSYLLAKLLFPYSMLLTRLTVDTITYPLLGLAIAQFPLYGLAATSFNATRFGSALLLPHAICAALCFSGLLPNFS